MSKIENSRPASTGPIAGPDSTEHIQETTSNESAKTKSISNATESTPTKQVVVDKYAVGDLKASGNQVKSHLDSELQNNRIKNKRLDDKELAKLPEGKPAFAAPYIPVGPTITGDNFGNPPTVDPQTGNAQTNSKKPIDS